MNYILVQVLIGLLVSTYMAYARPPTKGPLPSCNCEAVCRRDGRGPSSCPQIRCDCTSFGPCPNAPCPKGKRCEKRATGIVCIRAPCPSFIYTCVQECGPVCEIYCPYGRVFDENNCPTCACRYDPCIAALCPTNTTCVAKKIEDCVKAPCPEATAQCVANAVSGPTEKCSPICTKELNQVCGSNGVTYGNPCMLRYATCSSNGTIQYAYSGSCNAPVAATISTTTNCPRMCTMEYNPVCGSDGVTYGNSCQLRVAINCDKKENLSLAHLGAC